MDRPADTREHAAWLADKIVACGDYAKEAAEMLRRWPDAALAKPHPVGRALTALADIDTEAVRNAYRNGWNSHAAACRSAKCPNAAPAKCKRCGGSGVVDDGEIDCYSDGTPYMNGPIKCVKDCPACKATPPASQPAEAVSADDDEVWERIKNIPFDWTGDSNTLIRYARAILALAGTQAAAEPAPWIDVKDRLPTHLYSVLGVVVDGPMVVEGAPDDRMRDVVSYDPEEGHWHQYVGGDSLSARVTVTHWQDLPDLP